MAVIPSVRCAQRVKQKTQAVAHQSHINAVVTQSGGQTIVPVSIKTVLCFLKGIYDGWQAALTCLMRSLHIQKTHLANLLTETCLGLSTVTNKMNNFTLIILVPDNIPYTFVVKCCDPPA